MLAEKRVKKSESEERFHETLLTVYELNPLFQKLSGTCKLRYRESLLGTDFYEIGTQKVLISVNQCQSVFISVNKL